MSETTLKNDNSVYHKKFYILLAYAFIFRLMISMMTPYRIDMGGYVAWSRYLAQNGPAGLYGDFHIVYAPFYMYFLWLTGGICKLFSLSASFQAYAIKLWAVGFEFLGGFLLFKIAEKFNRPKQGLYMALFYVMNPGVFMNSSIWGQFDSIPATMLLGVLYLFQSEKYNPAALLFLIAVLTKPQSGLLLPVVLYLYFRDFKWDAHFFKRLGTGLISGIFLYLAIVMPFYSPTGKLDRIPGFMDPFYWLFDLYSKSIGDYPFATANGFNLWTLLGGQIQEDTLPFMGLTYSEWGYILLAIGLAYAFICLIKGKATVYAITYFSFLVLFNAFFFMTRMHERYLLAAVIFAAAACVYDRRHLFTAVLLSICVFCNQLYLYIISFEERYWLDRWDGIALFFAGLTLFTYVLAVCQGYKAFICHKVQGDKNG